MRSFGGLVMHIIHIASEMAPIAKAGGLGDVVHGLSKEQVRAGNRVEVILPKYDIIEYRHVENLSLEMGDLWSFEDGFEYHNAVFSATVDGIETHLIESHHNQYYFNRNTIYGTLNDIERFLYFCRTTLEYLKARKISPDIIHLHDWPTAAIAPLLKKLYNTTSFNYGSVVFTIHNMEHQGSCHPRALNRIGLYGLDLRTQDLMQDPRDPSLVNLLKGGIVFSDSLTTVSPKYAHEIQTTEMSFGLSETIKKHAHKLSGILNGIELETWNPASDQSLSENYPANPTYINTILQQKKQNRDSLYEKLKMAPTGGPLIVCISRLAKQKGPKLIQSAIHDTLEKGGAFILLGSTHDKHLEKEFLHIKKHYHKHPNLYIGLTFDEKLARQVYASADAIVIPSLFEPCGLTQMISMRYGTIPIARKTGGLADTIFDIDDESTLKSERTGFLFKEPSTDELRKTLERVFECFHNQKSTWNELIQSGVKLDLGWSSSQSKYQRLYEKTRRVI